MLRVIRLLTYNVAVISDLLALINLISEHAENTSVLSALFKYDCTRLKGDELIKVTKINTDNTNIWFYNISNHEDYIFVPFPVNPSVYVDFGTARGEANANSQFFRYVATPSVAVMSGPIKNNVLVDFMVFGYRPEDILNYSKGKTIR